MSHRTACSAAAALAIIAGSAGAQVVINEVYENPPGGGSVDDRFEYIELYGEPGTPLDGYIVLCLKGGADEDGDDLPGPVPPGSGIDPDEIYPEVDEAFSLDGLTIGASGFLVVYNNTGSASLALPEVPAGVPAFGFTALHIPGNDTAGRLANDTSSTYMLIRNAPSVWKKDLRPDVDFDGKTDFGFETPIVGGIGSVSATEPYQVVDAFAWSHLGGKEYVRDSQNEISDTPGFNPDAVSRLAYYFTNPMLGLRMNSDNETVPSRIADESFIYGDMAGTLGGFEYGTESQGPTDPNGDGFTRLPAAGFLLTPGDFNDGGSFTQFRFVRGDFDFDGVVTTADRDAITAMVGADFDALEAITDDMGMPVTNPNTGATLMQYTYQEQTAQQILAMCNMDKTDGPGGTNDITVTPDDVAAFNAEFSFGCSDADIAAPLGVLNFADVQSFLGAFGAGQPAADLAAPMGVFNFADVQTFLGLFGAGC